MCQLQRHWELTGNAESQVLLTETELRFHELSLASLIYLIQGTRI